MKALKIGALVMSALLLVMVLMMAYLFMTAEVTAQVVSSVGVSAAEQEGYFSALKTSVDEDTFIGTLYQKPTQWKDASEYVYLQFSVNVHNGCLVPIDMIEIQVVPQPTDILHSYQCPYLHMKKYNVSLKDSLMRPHVFLHRLNVPPGYTL